jgi:hypothetical protein
MKILWGVITSCSHVSYAFGFYLVISETYEVAHTGAYEKCIQNFDQKNRWEEQPGESEAYNKWVLNVKA